MDEINDKIDRATSRIDEISRALTQFRAPSKAAAIGSRSWAPDYESGSFISALAMARSSDYTEQLEGKAKLEALSRYETATGKATLGTTDATGGWILPNALVAELTKPRPYVNPYRDLMTVREQVGTYQIDLPYRANAPTRATIATWGSTKENVDLATAGYTATIYTLARIHDASNQYLRYSQGAAEQDIVTELGHAFALGEAYYIREGTGSTQPYGFTTALLNGPSEFRTTFTPSATTLAGSVAKAIATASGALMARNRKPEAAVISSAAYAALMSQGTDTAGFFVAGLPGAGDIPGLRPGTLISPWGIPIYVDTGIADDYMIVAEWSAMKIFHGLAYRIDRSDMAGDRWDKNLTGFRAEMELGFDARPAVYAGAAQMVTDLLP